MIALPNSHHLRMSLIERLRYTIKLSMKVDMKFTENTGKKQKQQRQLATVEEET